MSDTLHTTVIDLGGLSRRISRRCVELPTVSGHVYATEVVGDAAQNNRRTLCVPFTLPAPSSRLWPRLQALTLRDPAGLLTAITEVVSDWTKAQAVVQRAGVSGNRTLLVEPYPYGQSVAYLLTYACTEYEFDQHMDAWPLCCTCTETYVMHVDGRCNLELGGNFLSAYPTHLATVQRIVEFNNALPGWLTECADAIYCMAMEKLHAPEAEGSTRHSAGRIPPKDARIVTVEGSSAPGPGSGHAISGEPGDNNHR